MELRIKERRTGENEMKNKLGRMKRTIKQGKSEQWMKERRTGEDEMKNELGRMKRNMN